jgi:enhancer of mRNA-decapping protein 4
MDDDCDVNVVKSSPHIVILKGNDIPHSLSGYEVNIHSSLSRDNKASSKVRVHTITNQVWEHKRYHSNMVASTEDFLAYVLENQNGHFIRIIHTKTMNRTLLKKFTGKILDIAFASPTCNMLGAVDQGGNIFVYNLDAANGDVEKISNCLKLYIYGSSIPDDKFRRLKWCPQVAAMAGEEEDDETLLLAVCHNARVEIFDLPEIATRYSSGLAIEFTRMERGVTYLGAPHSGHVMDMAFSPDGQVLATAGSDGYIKFWQLNHDTIDETKQCLHSHKPHDGAPVERLVFLDNHLIQDSSVPFWRFLITAANDNCEVKIWCTVKWKCLQTIRFLPPVTGGGEQSPSMLLVVDESASYLIATDIMRNVS